LARQLRLKLNRLESFQREDFVVSPANAQAIKAVDAWPAWHGGCLALIGPEGSGKSHLALTWARAQGAAVLPAKGRLELGALQGRPVLYEDADRDRARRDEILFHLINMAGQPGGGLLLTARAPPSGWAAALPDLRSRRLSGPEGRLRDRPAGPGGSRGNERESHGEKTGEKGKAGTAAASPSAAARVRRCAPGPGPALAPAGRDAARGRGLPGEQGR